MPLDIHLPWQRVYTAASGHNLLAMKQLCPGYFEREVQEIIERMGPTAGKYFCALCGRPVAPRKKDGEWVPKNHAPLETENGNL